MAEDAAETGGSESARHYYFNLQFIAGEGCPMNEWTALDRYFWELDQSRKLIHGFMITVINIKAQQQLPDGWIYIGRENRKRQTRQ